MRKNQPQNLEGKGKEMIAQRKTFLSWDRQTREKKNGDLRVANFRRNPSLQGERKMQAKERSRQSKIKK